MKELLRKPISFLKKNLRWQDETCLSRCRTVLLGLCIMLSTYWILGFVQRLVLTLLAYAFIQIVFGGRMH